MLPTEQHAWMGKRYYYYSIVRSTFCSRQKEKSSRLLDTCLHMRETLCWHCFLEEACAEQCQKDAFFLNSDTWVALLSRVWIGISGVKEGGRNKDAQRVYSRRGLGAQMGLAWFIFYLSFLFPFFPFLLFYFFLF